MCHDGKKGTSTVSITVCEGVGRQKKYFIIITKAHYSWGLSCIPNLPSLPWSYIEMTAL